MPPGTPIQLRLPEEELDALDQYRRKFSNPPSRGRAARELVRCALAEDGHSAPRGVLPKIIADRSRHLTRSRVGS
jgi:hypothetical protein